MAAKTRKPKAEKHNGPYPMQVDFDQLDELCVIQCTAAECAAVLKMSPDTLDRRIQEAFGYGFAEYYAQKSPGGKASLRRRQWKSAEEGNSTMQIWLGKQYLGQSDKSESKVDFGIKQIEIKVVSPETHS